MNRQEIFIYLNELSQLFNDKKVEIQINPYLREDYINRYISKIKEAIDEAIKIIEPISANDQSMDWIAAKE